MKEVWKDVVGYENYFKVSNYGNIFSKRTNKILKLRVRSGYKQFTTRFGGRETKSVCFRVHRLVAEAFLDSPNEEQIKEANKNYYGVCYVNHIDCDRSNNHVSNLEWCTCLENAKHAVENSEFMKSSIERKKQKTILNKIEKFGLDFLIKVCDSTNRFGYDRNLAREFNLTRQEVKTILKYEYYWRVASR